jgi:hypothetical protein
MKKGQIEVKLTWHLSEGISSDQKKQELNRRARDLKNKVKLNSRVRFASNESKVVPRNLDPGPPI